MHETNSIFGIKDSILIDFTPILYYNWLNSRVNQITLQKSQQRHQRHQRHHRHHWLLLSSAIFIMINIMRRVAVQIVRTLFAVEIQASWVHICHLPFWADALESLQRFVFENVVCIVICRISRNRIHHIVPAIGVTIIHVIHLVIWWKIFAHK